MSATKTDYQGMITEITAKKLLFGPDDDYKKGHNDAMDKALTTVRNYQNGEGLFQESTPLSTDSKVLQGEALTVKKFMLKKFPTSEYMDCPVGRHHWDVIQEYAEAYHKSLTKPTP